MKRNLIPFALLFLFLVPTFAGIFHPGFFLTDDGNWMVVRLSAFYDALRGGQFPVRFLPQLNNGFGYPVSDFLYPLFLYLGSCIHLFHIPFVQTIKILFGISLFGGAIGMFLWLREKFSTIPSLTGAVIFSLFPYHMWDITKRGSLGEILALGIVPFIFWQIEKRNTIVVGVLLALLILSHNTLALLFLPVIVGYMMLENYGKRILLSLLVGLGLSVFFWFPALFDQQYTVFSKTTVSMFSDYFLTNNLYPLIGIISFVVFPMSLYILMRKQEFRRAFFLVVFLLSLSLTMSASRQIWIFLHLGTYIQFPFRFLSLVALSVGFLAADILTNWKNKQMIVIAGVLIVLVYVSSRNYFFANSYQYYEDSFYSTNQGTTTVQNEYMPIWATHTPATAQNIVITSGLVQNRVQKGTSLTFQTQSQQPSHVTVSFIYFPGWTVHVNNKNVQIIPTPSSGFISFDVPKGINAVSVSFKETSIRFLADIVSLLFVLGIVGYSLYRKKNI